MNKEYRKYDLKQQQISTKDELKKNIIFQLLSHFKYYN